VACAVIRKVIGFCFACNNEAMKCVNLQVRREIHKYIYINLEVFYFDHVLNTLFPSFE